MDLQRIIDALPGNYLVVTADQNFTMVASSNERLLTTMKTRDEVIGKPLFDVYTDDAADSNTDGIRRLRASLDQVISTGQTQHLSRVCYSLRHPPEEDGVYENRYWNVTNSPVLGDDGKVRYIIHWAEDVTVSLLAEESASRRLRENDERLNAALLASGTGTFYWDLYNNRLDMDIAMQRLFELEGLTEAWLEDLLQKVHPGDRHGIVQQCGLCASYGEDFEMQFRVILADNTERWVFNKGRTFPDESGRPSYMVGACVDITHHKRTERALHRLNETLEQRVNAEVAARAKTEAALRQAQKMEAVGQLTGGLAHDFNNLLAGIIGSLELLAMRLQQGRTSGLAGYVDSALNSANRATALTHRLLAFSRRQTLDPSPTDLNALVDGIMELLQRTTGPLVQYATHPCPQLWSTLCDANQLENALLNLTINARDAMPDGGLITLTTSNLSLGPEDDASIDCGLQPGDYVTLAVSDTGVGIEPEKLAYVFDPFFTTKPMGEGTGLGLSMVYGFAKQSGGNVRIESRIGHGTTVWLYLPRCECQSAPISVPAQATQPILQVEGRTVMVVDDEPNVRSLVVEILQEMGLNTLAAADGTSALQTLNNESHVDLLISDIGLPGGMNGRQLADAVRQRQPKLPVLFITGYAEGSVLHRNGLDRDYEVLTKPFSINALEDKVKSMLQPRQDNPRDLRSMS